jgi:hypothetical protein
VLADILANGRQFYTPFRDQAFIPVEFQIGYRFGHSLVRPSYRANLAGDNGQPFFGMIFDPSQEGAADPDDLRGGARAPRRFIGWQTFFDFADGEVKPNKRIDTKISTPLWYYILKEAELMEEGLQLGPVGGRIVAEVFIGLLQTDPSSYINVQPDWVPMRTGNPEDFRMIDFLTFAGVDPASRGQ